MNTPYIQNRLYLKQSEMIKARKALEVVPVNFEYQGLIIVTTGLTEYNGTQFVFQTNGCGCGCSTVRGAYFEEEIPWSASGLRASFAAGTTKDREFADQKVINVVYKVRLPVGETEKGEVTAALKSHFGADRDIHFF